MQVLEDLYVGEIRPIARRSVMLSNSAQKSCWMC